MQIYKFQRVKNQMIQILPMSSKYVSQVAYLHNAVLSGMLTQLGKNIVKIFYQTALNFHYNFGYVAVNSNKLIGFVFCTFNSASMYMDIFLRQIFPVIINILPKVICHPKLISYFKEMLTKKIKTNINCKTELVYIAVHPNYRRGKIGQQLIEKVNSHLLRLEIKKYELNVNADNQQAILFYENMHFKKEYKLREFGIEKYRYSFDILSIKKLC